MARKPRFIKHHVNDKRNYYRETYLRSEHWVKLKAKALEKFQRCSICGGWEHLDVHHKSYRNLYDVTPEDVVVLCRKHHDLVHAGTSRFSAGMKELILEHRLNAMLAVAAEFKAKAAREAMALDPF